MDDLSLRSELIKRVIALLEQTDDPRKDEALAHYRGQLAEIEAQIDAQPKPVVIGLKTAVLTARR